jgi:hypothetical protein
MLDVGCVRRYRNYTHGGYRATTKFGTSTVKAYDPAVHGEIGGAYAAIRKTLDYSWHVNYTPERRK